MNLASNGQNEPTKTDNYPDEEMPRTPSDCRSGSLGHLLPYYYFLGFTVTLPNVYT